MLFYVLITAVPVSYTHLDVYKRQLYRFNCKDSTVKFKPSASKYYNNTSAVCTVLWELCGSKVSVKPMFHTTYV